MPTTTSSSLFWWQSKYIFLFSILIAGIILNLSFFYIYRYPISLDIGVNIDKSTIEHSLAFQRDGGVFLLGDSLIYRTCTEYNLIGKLISRTSRFQLGYSNYGVNADTILQISQRLHTLLPTLKEELGRRRSEKLSAGIVKPALVFLFWDSDVSDIDETFLTKKQIEDLRDRYQSTLKDVIQQIISTGAKLVISGPGVLGSHWKTNMLDEYREINRRICEDFNIKYVDLRALFIAREQPYLSGSTSGSDVRVEVTVDGEHLNDLGASIVADILADIIHAWQQEINK